MKKLEKFAEDFACILWGYIFFKFVFLTIQETSANWWKMTDPSRTTVWVGGIAFGLTMLATILHYLNNKK